MESAGEANTHAGIPGGNHWDGEEKKSMGKIGGCAAGKRGSDEGGKKQNLRGQRLDTPVDGLPMLRWLTVLGTG